MRILILLVLMLFFRGNCQSFHFTFTTTPPSHVQQDMLIAAAYIEQFMELTHTINVTVSFADLGNSILAESAPTIYCAHPDNVSFPFVMVPAALYVQLSGAANCPLADDNFHITVVINTRFLDHFDFNPFRIVFRSRYSFVTAMMHELVHGLGMDSSVSGSGVNALAPFCNVYDCYVFFKSYITGAIAAPSTLADPAVLTSNALFFNGTYVYSYFSLYAPSVFAAGTSVVHTNFLNLMAPTLHRGENWLVLNDNIFGMLATLGYTMANCDTPDLDRCGNCLPNYPCYITSSANTLDWFFFNTFF